MSLALEGSKQRVAANFRSEDFASQVRPEDEIAETAFLQECEAEVALVQECPRDMQPCPCRQAADTAEASAQARRKSVRIAKAPGRSKETEE